MMEEVRLGAPCGRLDKRRRFANRPGMSGAAL